MSNDFIPPSVLSRRRDSVNLVTEATAGISIFFTMSYIFLLNPSLLTQAGMDPGAAFFSTALTAIISTVFMGLYAKLPYAVAPVPTVTTFFTFFICQTMKIPWPEALTCVLLSGIISVIATLTSVRAQLIESMPDGLKTSLMFAVGGFLVANGLKLGGLVNYDKMGIVLDSQFWTMLLSKSAVITAVGLSVAAILNSRLFALKTGPLVGLIAATVTAVALGIPLKRPTFDLSHIFSTSLHFGLPELDWPSLSQFIFATIIFFIVDFYGAIGKLVALTKLLSSVDDQEDVAVRSALMVDSLGTVLGATLGTSSVAVFISSAVGIKAGGRTGLTALWCAAAIAASVVVMPLVGAVPTVVNAGVLIYIGLILMPWKSLWDHRNDASGRFQAAVAIVALLVSLLTYGIDKGLLVSFAAYTVVIASSTLRKALEHKEDAPIGAVYLYVTTALLTASVLAQQFLFPPG